MLHLKEELKTAVFINADGGITISQEDGSGTDRQIVVVNDPGRARAIARTLFCLARLTSAVIQDEEDEHA